MFDPWPTVLGVPLGAWLFGVPLLFAGLAFALRSRLAGPMQPLWKVLDGLYFLFGLVGAACLVAILLLSTSEMVGRDLLPWASVTGGKKFAAYAMATSTFLVLPHALNRGAHIRVSVLLNLNSWTKRWIDIFALALSAIIATYFARFLVMRLQQSKLFNWRTDDRDTVPNLLADTLSLFVSPSKWSATMEATSAGAQSTPQWLVMLPICLGAILFAICLWDNLYRVIITGENRIKSEGV